MNITQIEEIVQKLALDIIALEVNKDEFIYQLMAAYGHRKTTIGRIKSGERNLAKVEGEVRAKRHIYFKKSQNNCVLTDIDNMKKEPSVARDKIRFVIATDFNQFVALDTRTHDTLDIEFNELGKHFDFFLPWAGMEKAVYQGENPADVKAAEKMAKLFDLIKADNFSDENKDDTRALHNLNVFLTRLLFCFFAEDTGIFKQNQFSAELESHTKVDGSDVDSYLNRLFEILNTSKENRGDLPEYLANFEYVNGGLFANTIASPKFSTKSRKMLIECGSALDWSDINPDIFGSMIQAVVHPDQRGGMGMHYTSVTNIMKVIEPLFLDEIYAELENIEDNIDAKLKPSRLRKLHDRIAEIRIFDPACGSGNFLIIAFKELRKLEMEIIKRLQELDQNDNQDDLFGDVGLDSSFSRIKLSQFYGIELDDFAHEVAILSLWLAEHQMNVEFKAEFGECEAALPLKESGSIINKNALRCNWVDICSNEGEVYIIGNPPYLGSKMQTKEQKADLEVVFGKKASKILDYIAGWFYKASLYINTKHQKAAFVTTNSICQGEQVAQLWPHVFESSVEIIFAHTSFKWTNSAKQNAAVICAIVGLGLKNNDAKKLFTGSFSKAVKNISPYLSSGENIVVQSAKSSLNDLPKLCFGNMANDGGGLILSPIEREELIEKEPNLSTFIRLLMGSSEFIRGNKRYCLWLKDEDLPVASKSVEVQKRIERTKQHRLASKDKGTNTLANRSHQFRDLNEAQNHALIIPRVSSERRKYIPIGFLDKNTIISDSAMALYDCDFYLFTLITSELHMVWVRAVAGRLKTDFRYSAGLCYNTFPFIKFSQEQKEKLENLAVELLTTREQFSDKSLSKLYDPDLMPEKLINAHKEIDEFVESLYQIKKGATEDEKLSVLLTKYKEMIGNQNA
jgi:type II restriction/modification system DNA methylase subunit YeeA